MRTQVRRIARKLLTQIRSIRYHNNPEKIVALGYDEVAGNYGNWTLEHERADREKYTALLLKYLQSGSDLLELGCGPGEPTTRHLTSHYQVTANDISASCLELAKRNAPKARFIPGDMTELSFPAGSFDGVVAYYAFHHIPRDRYASLIGRIYGWLRPGGYFMAAFYPYDVQDLVTENWHGAPMYWSSFAGDQTLKLVENAGFEIAEKSLESAVEDGKETTFLWIIARKGSAA